MRRREFITLLGGAVAAWPLKARAQQPAMPVVGFLSARGSAEAPQLLAAFRQGLKDKSFVEGQNVAIEYRFAENQNGQLPALAADLVHRQVTVIFATTTPAALAAKAATTTVPIVFSMGADPVQVGLVASLSRPGGNVTGNSNLSIGLVTKRIELMRQVISDAKLIAALVNPLDSAIFASEMDDTRAAQPQLGVQIHFLQASTLSDIDAAFAKVVELRASALAIGSYPLFISRPDEIAALATRYGVPAIHPLRAFAAAGGLMSYGCDFAEAHRLAGAYVGRILKGEKPGDLPVQQSTKVELTINLKTAKALGLNIPNTLIGRADEVIE
jgi:putative tryptophan/tyrosine transport system substrate-binding protein